MKINDLFYKDNEIYRVVFLSDFEVVFINCLRKAAPKKCFFEDLGEIFPCKFEELCERNDYIYRDIEDFPPNLRRIAYKRYTLIAGILPFLDSDATRVEISKKIAKENGISVQTVNEYLWKYLVYNDVSALAPKEKEKEKPLNVHQKNMRWALNKFFYTKHKNTLVTAYTLMLKEKYTDKSGNLLPFYPSIYQFRYFYKTHKKLETFYISRDGLSNYQRNNRPFLGCTTKDFAVGIGTAMLDSTICDIYLVDDSGALAGRPILAVCVDAYSGLCNGYYLGFDSDVASLKSLISNVTANKKEYCKSFGIEIDNEQWDCFGIIPGVLVTDQGSEYASSTFEQISELGCTVINLPPFRPELKGMVEKFFDVIQRLYKPHLKGKGIIEPDYAQRGARDYRKDACLTLKEFETILLRCIVYYNSERINEGFPLTDEMMKSGVKPTSSGIWNYAKNVKGANLIPVTTGQINLTLMPRTVGTFSKKGLKVNGLRYSKEGYTEAYLKGGTVTVAYDANDVSRVYLIENSIFTEFSLIESCFEGKTLKETAEIKDKRKSLYKSVKEDNIKAKIELINHIKAISVTKEVSDYER